MQTNTANWSSIELHTRQISPAKDLPELKELVSLLRYSSNNLNQIAKRANETGNVYDVDLEDIWQRQEQLWTVANKILSALASIE